MSDLTIRENQETKTLTLSNSSGCIVIDKNDIDFIAIHGSRPPRPVAKPVQYPHYFKQLPAGTTHVDIYAVLDLFAVMDHPVGHAIKKLLCPGQRGEKSKLQDITEARDTLNRAIEILKAREGSEG